MKHSRLVFAVILLTSVLPAREKKDVLGTIGGSVIDDRTENPIAGAIVKVPALIISDTTDSAGRYQFKNIHAKRYDFEISAKGYNPCVKPSIVIKSGTNKDLIVPLQKSSVHELDKIVVTSKKIHFKKSDQSTSVINLTREEIENSPGALADVNEVLKILPSAAGSGWDWDNTLLVRGGGGSENVYLIDGIEVNNISHWGMEHGSGGAINSFHSGFIDNVDFYAGGFPAYAPPRLSSVTEMHLRNGSMTDRIYQFDLNMAGVGLFLEGPLVPGRASYIINGRVSFLDLIQKLINTDGLPMYQNGQMKLAWDITSEHSLSVNVLGMHDEIGGKDSTNRWKDENSRLIGGIGWEYTGANWKNRMVFSGTYAKNRYQNNQGRNMILEDAESDIRERFQLRNRSTLFLRDHDALSFGADLQLQTYNEGRENESYYFFADTAGEYQITKYFPDINEVYAFDSNFVEQVDPEARDTSLTGYRVGGHLSYTLVLNKWKIQAGMRNDYYSILSKHGPSPRLSVSLDLDNIGIFSVSSGLFYQFPTFVNILSMKNFLEDLPLQRNWQGALGYEKQLGKHVVSGVEVYFKQYDQEPLFYLDDQRRKIDTLLEDFGEKRAFGLELFVQKKKKDIFYYNISYTLLSSEMQYKDKQWYPDDFNLRNNATIVLGSQFHRFHAFSLRFDLSEGFPYTPIDTAASDIYTRYNVADGWNSKRRSFRAKIGLRYDLTWYLPRFNFTLYAEVKNLLNQRDVLFEYYNPTEGGSIAKFEGMGILPIGGLQVDF